MPATKDAGKPAVLSSRLLDMKFMKKPGSYEEEDNKDDGKENLAEPSRWKAVQGSDAGEWSMPYKPAIKSALVPKSVSYSDIQRPSYFSGRKIFRDGSYEDVAASDPPPAPVKVPAPPEETHPRKRNKREDSKFTRKKSKSTN